MYKHTINKGIPSFDFIPHGHHPLTQKRAFMSAHSRLT